MQGGANWVVAARGALSTSRTDRRLEPPPPPPQPEATTPLLQASVVAPPTILSPATEDAGVVRRRTHSGLVLLSGIGLLSIGALVTERLGFWQADHVLSPGVVGHERAGTAPAGPSLDSGTGNGTAAVVVGTGPGAAPPALLPADPTEEAITVPHAAPTVPAGSGPAMGDPGGGVLSTLCRLPEPRHAAPMSGSTRPGPPRLTTRPWHRTSPALPPRPRPCHQLPWPMPPRKRLQRLPRPRHQHPTLTLFAGPTACPPKLRHCLRRRPSPPSLPLATPRERPQRPQPPQSPLPTRSARRISLKAPR